MQQLSKEETIKARGLIETGLEKVKIGSIDPYKVQGTLTYLASNACQLSQFDLAVKAIELMNDPTDKIRSIALMASLTEDSSLRKAYYNLTFTLFTQTEKGVSRDDAVESVYFAAMKKKDVVEAAKALVFLTDGIVGMARISSLIEDSCKQEDFNTAVAIANVANNKEPNLQIIIDSIAKKVMK